jgi:DNA-binding MarR family transcriptional regulator
MTRSKGQLANDAWEALLASHACLMKGFVAEDSWDQVSMREYDVLYALSKQREAINASQLQEWVLLSQPALSRMVDRLVNRGWVHRGVDAEDRRNVQLALTPAGRQVQRSVGRKHARGVVRAMNVLSAVELEQLEALCAKLSNENRKERGQHG